MNNFPPQQIKYIESLLHISTMSIMKGGDKLSEKDLSDFRYEAESFLFKNFFYASNSLYKNLFYLHLTFLAFPYNKLIKGEKDGV